MALPKVVRVRQGFDRTRLPDVCGAVAAGLRDLGLAPRLQPGSRIAITAGSRGINNLVGMTRTAAEVVSFMGGRPFIVPSMGSHGGATDEGQRTLLAELGISETSMGCPVVSSMEVEEIGRTTGGVPVYLDRNAMHADGIIVINRVKPHTAFRGEVESGLCKMLAVGLGKHKGAQQMHAAGLGLTLVEAARLILARAPVWPASPFWRIPWTRHPRSTSSLPSASRKPIGSCSSGPGRCSPASPSTPWVSWSWTRWERTSAGQAWTSTS
jgi:hypothetical protein